jgi:hypothetical protein
MKIFQDLRPHLSDTARYATHIYHMVEKGNTRFPFRSGLCPKVNHLLSPSFCGMADFQVGAFMGYENRCVKSGAGADDAMRFIRTNSPINEDKITTC